MIEINLVISGVVEKDGKKIARILFFRDEKVKRLEEYERKYSPIIIDFEKMVGSKLWSEH
jgi:hypothetical protein